MQTLLRFVTLLTLLTGLTGAASVKLAWNANPENDIAGYRLAYGTVSGRRETVVETGNVTRYELVGLTEGQTYFFTLQAVNTAAQVSEWAAEISYLVPVAPKPPARPTGLRITLQSSADNRQWDDRLVLYARKEDAEFFRVKTEVAK